MIKLMCCSSYGHTLVSEGVLCHVVVNLCLDSVGAGSASMLGHTARFVGEHPANTV